MRSDSTTSGGATRRPRLVLPSIVATALALSPACSDDDAARPDASADPADAGVSTDAPPGPAADGPVASADGPARADAVVAADGATDAEPYLIMRRDTLLGLPTTGSAWTFLKEKADEAVALSLDPASAASPWLPDYQVVAPRYLAAALVVASAWPGDKAPYRQTVEDAIRHVIGSELEPSADGTSSGDALLATCRQLAAWVMAADLIGLDRRLTGSRPGWTAVAFEDWLAAVRTQPIGTHGRWRTIVGTQESSASNWGAHCGAARLAASLYLGDTVDVERAALVFRGALGDGAAYPAYPPSEVPAAGAGFQTTSSFDASWACPYEAAIGGWRPINPSDCGPAFDGIVVEDIGRSAGAQPTWDATGIGYTYESLGAHHLSALLLERAGHPAFAWSDAALARGMRWLERQGQLPSTDNGSTQRHISWVTNHFCGTTLPTQPAAMGRSLGFTDWLFP